MRRFRLPRTLYKFLPIIPYNEIKEIERKNQRDKAKGKNVILISLNNEKLYLENSTEIISIPKMWGFNNALAFYEGVETQESFETDFKPISADSVDRDRKRVV